MMAAGVRFVQISDHFETLWLRQRCQDLSGRFGPFDVVLEGSVALEADWIVTVGLWIHFVGTGVFPGLLSLQLIAGWGALRSPPALVHMEVVGTL